jgi:catechol 2,3-dioxygenase-like lactoylglutathione lyase family enzyme
MIHTYENGRISRRSLLGALPLALVAPRVLAQAAAPPIQVRKLTHFTLLVSDVGRSVEFYQGLFGMPVQARQGSSVLLRLGSGPQFLALSPAGVTRPRIDRFGLSVQNFEADRVMQQLAAHGVTAGDGGQGSLSGGPMKARIVTRGPTRELYFGDPDGIVVQLQDTTYCGGGGVQGNMCGAVEPSPKKGLLAVRDLSHFTIFGNDAQRSNAFYQSVFGLGVQARQGPNAPLLGVGDKIQFLMFAGGGPARGGGAPRPASINHVCLNMEGFDRDGILKTLEGYGIKPRGDNPGTPPLISYVSTRMPNRGGAPEGTPEVYFTDPDGLLIQLQDVRYCGGSGYLGDVCAG